MATAQQQALANVVRNNEALNALRNNREELLAALNVADIPVSNPAGTTWSNKGIDAAYPNDFLSGQVRLGLKGVISALESAAATLTAANEPVQAFAKLVEAEVYRGYIDTMAGTGLDFANSALRTKLDELQTAGALSADAVAKLKAMAITYQSIAQQHLSRDAIMSDAETIIATLAEQDADAIIREKIQTRVAKIDAARIALVEFVGNDPDCTDEEIITQFNEVF